MVMKRRLPSKLTQAKPVQEDEPVTTDFEMSPEEQAIFPVEEEHTPKEVAKETPQETAKPTPPVEDVFEDIPERKEAAPKEETQQKIEASQPSQNRMKRKVTNKRPRKRSAEDDALKKSIAQKPLPKPEKMVQMSEGSHLKDMDISDSSTQRPDAEDVVKTAFADIDGTLPDPAEQEIEAAYQPTEELEKTEKNEHHVDAAALVEKVVEEQTETLPEDTTPIAEKPAPVEEIPEVDINQFEPPKSLADEDEAMVTATVKPAEDAWLVDNLVQDTAPMAPPPASESDSAYKDILSSAKAANKPLPPPELPETQIGVRDPQKASPLKMIFMLVILVGVGFLGYKLFSGGDKTQERIARFTGALTEVSENIPEEVGGAQKIDNPDMIQPEKVVSSEEIKLLEEEARVELAEIEKSEEKAISSVIEILDVDPATAAKPIVAEGDEVLPEEVGLIAGLQKAIMKQREKSGDVVIEAPKVKQSKSKEAQSPIEKLKEGRDLQTQLEEELAEYRRALMEAENPAERPKPNAFFNKLHAEKAKKGEEGEEGETEMVPPAAQDLPPSNIYTDNPYNLPVIPEPKAEAENTVRILEDFDVSLFTPERGRVRMPKGVRPRLRASDFPQVEILSLIPDRGIIAVNRGQEGVLLIGEVVEGWELVDVYEGYAEFRSGTRKHVLTLTQ